MKSQRKLFFISCLLMIPALILMTLPNSLSFAIASGAPNDRRVRYFDTSYFDTMFSAHVICPLFGAVVLSAWLILSIIMILWNKYGNFFYIAGFPSVIFAVMTNFWMGGGTVYTVIISLLEVAAFVLQFLAIRQKKKTDGDGNGNTGQSRSRKSFIK